MRRTFLVILASGFLGSCIVPESTHIEPTYHLLSEKELRIIIHQEITFTLLKLTNLLQNTFYLSEVDCPLFS